jgi:2'-5' RNA ligase
VQVNDGGIVAKETGLTRLFVALELPPAMCAELALRQPQPTPGIRLVDMQQMHLTLHFIGEASLPHVADALKIVQGRPFRFSIAGLGKFSGKDGRATIWAKVPANQALEDLHDSIGVALSVTGFHPDLRPYRPHITLARCTAPIPADLIDHYMATNAPLELPSIDVAGFALYSSTTTSAGVQYRIEQWYRLMM